MAFRTLAAVMLAGAIPADKLDLTDDFAFTGAVTVDGAGVSTGADVGLQRVAAATTANVASFTGAPDEIDGYSLQVGDKILVLAQTNKSQNGIYVVTTVGTGANGEWERHESADDAAELPRGLMVIVTNGDTLGGALFMLQVFDGTLGSDNLVFGRFDEGLTPYAAENLVNVGTGDGSNLVFDLPKSGTVQLVVFVGLLPQLGTQWQINAGAGTGGVDQLELAEAPANGVPVDVIGFTRG